MIQIIIFNVAGSLPQKLQQKLNEQQTRANTEDLNRMDWFHLEHFCILLRKQKIIDWELRV